MPDKAGDFTPAEQAELDSLKTLPLTDRVELLERARVRQQSLMERTLKTLEGIARTLRAWDQARRNV